MFNFDGGKDAIVGEGDDNWYSAPLCMYLYVSVYHLQVIFFFEPFSTIAFLY